MNKVYCILAFLAVLAVSHGQDYLEGGYVGSGDNSEIRQYFTDPIFYAPSGQYVSSGEAGGQTQESAGAQRQSVALGSVVARPATGKTATANGAAIYMAPVNAAGRWHLELSDGQSIDLDLFQYGTSIFGRGSLASGLTVQEVTASGTASGSIMTLEVVPESGTQLYAMTLDISRLYLPSPYKVFRAGDGMGSGTVRASRVP
jgi:hypothetical protein